MASTPEPKTPPRRCLSHRQILQEPAEIACRLVRTSISLLERGGERFVENPPQVVRNPGVDAPDRLRRPFVQKLTECFRLGRSSGRRVARKQVE